MLPFEGIKVVELAGWVVGPAVGAVLGDWGADVIKIEDPAGGDPLRGLEIVAGRPAPQKYTQHDVANRSKRSIALDLKKEEGRKIAYELMAKADVFVTNFREDGLARLGMDYETLCQLNPRLIYAYVSGYGDKGSDSSKAGFDVAAYWARGGFMAHLGDEGTPPVRQLGGLGDMPSGMHMAGGVAAALFVRERTGIAQRISLSLLNSAIWTQGINIQIAREYGSYPRANRKTAANPLANGYQAKDGKWIMLVMLQPDRRWPDFCKAMGLEHLINDPKFTPMQNRYQNREELIAILDRVFATKTRAEWLEKFKDYDLQWDPVNTFNDLIEDPQALVNDDFAPIEHPSRGLVWVPASPIRFSKTPASVRRHAPELGEQTEEVLLEMGYSWEQIAGLKESKVIL